MMHHFKARTCSLCMHVELLVSVDVKCEKIAAKLALPPIFCALLVFGAAVYKYMIYWSKLSFGMLLSIICHSALSGC